MSSTKLGLILADNPLKPTKAEVDKFYSDFSDLWSAVKEHLFDAYHIPDLDATILCGALWYGLVCKSQMPDPMIMGFPPRVDLAWHGALLNTKLYREMCERAFGRFIEHTTTTVKDSDDMKQARIRVTLLMYKELFKCAPPAGIWRVEDRAVSKAMPREQPAKKRRADGSINLYVKLLDGVQYEIGPFSPNLSIMAVKHFISTNDWAGTAGTIRLCYAGRDLDDDSVLKDTPLRDGDTVHLVERLRGC